MPALLELRGLRRDYPSGDQTIAALKDVDLAIEAGEMVAIIGASGSGKSTLMNILGCLDRPTQGSYRIAGRDVGLLGPDDLAELRREHFGFIFQRYHLLGNLTAQGNVEIPAIYAGRNRSKRRRRATGLLARLGLADRQHHRPDQLSGGQQQRVSIARALMNGGQVILADEPTGALDRRSGEEMMVLLEELHAEGHTIIIVTHSPDIAAHAERVIEISDGEIVADRRRSPSEVATRERPRRRDTTSGALPDIDDRRDDGTDWRADIERYIEAFRMALLAMASHRLRTFLTMLGIIIGIASVVSVVALGEGSRQRILEDINSIGTNTIDIFSGRGFGDERSGAVRTLVPDDAEALKQQGYVDSVTPSVSNNASLRYRNISVSGQITGVSEQYFRVRGYEIAEGMAFTSVSVQRQSQDVVIDNNTRKKLFGINRPAVGEVIFLGDVPCRVIGVTKAKTTPFGNSESLNVWIPFTTAMSRMLGQSYLRSITVRVSDAYPPAMAEHGIVRLLTKRHGSEDFYVMNTDTIRQTIEKTTQTMTLLISLIALISLIVGGIGVMNIMLVSVTERTREIGVRIAVGARRNDILRQFLIEAVLVCLFGGILGVGLALVVHLLFTEFGGTIRMVFSPLSIVAAFACSTLIGVIFGFLPARNAARLDPVEALARE
ncbi:MacB family efflux pump subunit [Telmatospirillum sp.]|uniref:MacB family efflux pump subunit n=1 Tax=Telmatospirillum sp. TaxID=2079197 RepID=UPI002843DB47|nr:MacB family efflux pump subunit [Telmatospirillum sp.]MDR3436913.1 MacB family efflux pump subunit [Telmatospirillum sp.]